MRKLTALLLVAGLLSVALLSGRPPPPLRLDDRPLLPRAGLLKALFKAQLGLVADYFWVMTINRVGAASTVSEYRDIYYYADLTTDLDPRFAKVYTFAGITIPIHLGREQYANVEESSRILRKGIANTPEDKRIHFQLAYNLMFFERRYREAAAIVEELAREPGAPEWYSGLATRLYAQAGEFETSLSLAQMLRDSAEDEETRTYYERRVNEILQEQLLQQLDEALQRHKARTGQLPGSLEALVSSGDLSELPGDPLGGKLFLGDDGRAYSTAARFRLELIHNEKTSDGKRLVPKPMDAKNHESPQP
ncbi:pilus assembly protein PilG [Myxococcus llanfairpwllgwyngyllgogerychwyrndrobwllllantysiliogogogochensis]|uniref:Pilus assembly protein PilG n=1 Tax=Myxococcus llanfairpwllgwyngyllgogerychwyrndrobwllllantysiliogogogochensis TaxID=2590453 RepID=A0A540X2G3_9BACT|nr:pilus assembly protein PilG [Myxococcus llanfairpwllgwyngyllgogerychwyrndrobwllllantysiliogogogochensis]TQF15461.1 pilus assembly protein PilG [Myxococcus llanfairpwllgwyngyllgogerychwyrndrobwllllantysiliogogogochensis]